MPASFSSPSNFFSIVGPTLFQTFQFEKSDSVKMVGRLEHSKMDRIYFGQKYLFSVVWFIWGFTSLSTLYRSYHDG